MAFAQPEETLFLSSITIGELRRGIELLPTSKRRAELERWLSQDLMPRVRNRILPVDEVIASRWGQLSAERQRIGSPLGIADGLIAATAAEHNIILATRNTKDFVGLGVELLNPWQRF